MTYQNQFNGYVAFKAQGALGSPASGGSGTLLRIAGGAGGKYTTQPYGSNEVRRDGMRTRGRHGSNRTSGVYSVEVSLDMMDALYEAVFRGTYESELAVTEATASLTSITTGANSIAAGGGSWITAGLRVGDVARLTGHSSAGNNSRNLRLVGVTADTLTTAEDLTVNAVADTAFTLTRPGQKLINPAADSLVKTYFTVEEYDADLDLSRIFTDVIFHSLKFSMAPNGLLMCEISWTGTGAHSTASGGSSPSLTSPAESTGLPLACRDATMRYGSSDLADLTSWDLTIDLGASAPDVIGSRVSPDVATGQMSVSMNFAMLMADYTEITDFINETALSFSVLAVENESEPKDFISLFVPNFTLGGVDPSPFSKDPGFRTKTISVPPDLVGKDTSGGAYDATMIKLQVSNT